MFPVCTQRLKQGINTLTPVSSAGANDCNSHPRERVVRAVRVDARLGIPKSGDRRLVERLTAELVSLPRMCESMAWVRTY